ncbi:MAG: hypothetical protein ACC657_14770 [Thiohalomonadales bacterium]
MAVTKDIVIELVACIVDNVERRWLKLDEYWSVCAELLQLKKEIFETQGIAIPYSQHVIRRIQTSQ